jgi:hypothetical protein
MSDARGGSGRHSTIEDACELAADMNELPREATLPLLLQNQEASPTSTLDGREAIDPTFLMLSSHSLRLPFSPRRRDRPENNETRKDITPAPLATTANQRR